MTTVMIICGVMLSIAALLGTVRLVIGPTLADRVFALDSLLAIVVIAVGVWTAVTRRGTYIEALLVAALVPFIGTTTVARFIERRGGGSS